MEQLEKEIIEWHTATFPLATLESQIMKFREEREEMEEADNYRDYINELCDCYIVALSFSRFGNAGKEIQYYLLNYIDNIRKEHTSWFIDKYAIVSFIKDKLEINKQRKWDFVNGVYRHIKE